jgi:hypothetical protein
VVLYKDLQLVNATRWNATLTFWKKFSSSINEFASHDLNHSSTASEVTKFKNFNERIFGKRRIRVRMQIYLLCLPYADIIPFGKPTLSWFRMSLTFENAFPSLRNCHRENYYQLQ